MNRARKRRQEAAAAKQEPTAWERFKAWVIAMYLKVFSR